MAVYRKMQRAVSGSGVFISTPTSIKTFMLQYLSVLQEAEHGDRCLSLTLADFKRAKFGNAASKAAEWFRARDEIADELAKVLELWKGQGIAVIDEVDLVLDPMKSELNFPVVPQKICSRSLSGGSCRCFFLNLCLLQRRV
jgi:hypothetical protein